MKKLILLFLISSLIILMFNGCSSQLTNGRIPKIDKLKADNVVRVSIRKDIILTDKKDISIFLACMKNIRLKEKSKDPVPEYSSKYEIIFLNGSIVTLSFDEGRLSFGEDWYLYENYNNPISRGYVQLLSQGKVQYPVEHWVYSQSLGGLCADGMRFGAITIGSLEELRTSMDKLEAIPYSEDFTFKAVWEADPEEKVTLRYSVFDDEFYELSSNTDTPIIPENNGTYYIVTEHGWGTDYYYAGYQYIFKVVR